MANRIYYRTVRSGHLTAGRQSLATLLAGILAGCTPPTMPASSAVGDGPRAAPLVLVSATPTLPGRYTTTHGEVVSGVGTPWVEETASLVGVDSNWLVRAIGIKDVAPGRMPVILMSPAHRTGEWSYVRSETARVYQLLPVRPVPICLVALVAAAPPDVQVLGVPASSWVLGALGCADEAAAVLRLETPLPPEAIEMWDGISTSLQTVDGEISVEIEYSHTGGGDPCDQRFSFRARAEVGPSLVLTHADHQAAPCPALGL